VSREEVECGSDISWQTVLVPLIKFTNTFIQHLDVYGISVSKVYPTQLFFRF